jgi:methionine sulfoxide reductase heme-binding subunit
MSSSLHRWRRLRKRLLRHYLPLVLVSALVSLGLMTVITTGGLRLRFTIVTAYVGLIWLSITLLIGPLNIILKRPNPVSNDLRRDVGIWGATIILLHVLVGLQIHASSAWHYFLRKVDTTQWPMLRSDPYGLANHVGLAATVIVVLLLLLSNDYALRRLGIRRWKAFQRWNYGLFTFTIVHGIMYLWIERRSLSYLVLLGGIAVVVVVIQWMGIKYWSKRHSGRRHVS